MPSEVQRAAGVRQRDDAAAQLHDFLRGVLRDVAGAGDRHAFAIEAAWVLWSISRRNTRSRSRWLPADQAAAVGQALAGQDGSELVGQALVLAEEEADLATADADVTGRHVEVGADVAVQLAHERLAEAHDPLSLLPLGLKSDILPPPMGSEVREFLKSSKARNLSTPRLTEGWKRRPPFVRADGAVHLDAETAVDLAP